MQKFWENPPKIPGFSQNFLHKIPGDRFGAPKGPQGGAKVATMSRPVATWSRPLALPWGPWGPQTGPLGIPAENFGENPRIFGGFFQNFRFFPMSIPS